VTRSFCLAVLLAAVTPTTLGVAAAPEPRPREVLDRWIVAVYGPDAAPPEDRVTVVRSDTL
jgi:hypothetical protein